MAPRQVYRSSMRVPVMQAAQIGRVDVSSGGLAIADAVQQREDRERAAELNGIDVSLATQMSDIREQGRQTDWREKVQDFESRTAEIRASTIGNIRDPRVKAAAEASFQRLYLNGLENVRQDAYEGRRDHHVAETETALERFAKDAAAARSPDERKIALENGSKAIASLIDANFIDEAKGKQWAQKFQGSADLFTAEALAGSNPGTAFRLFSNQAEAQKRFPGLDPREILRLKDQSEREIRQRETERRTVAAAESAAASSVLSVRINQFANGQGDDVGQSEIDKLKGSLTPSAWASIQKQYDDARAKRTKDDADRVDVAARIDAGIGIDPGDTKQKKAYDAFFKTTVVPAINAKFADLPDDQRAAAVTASVLDFVKKQGVIPETMISGLRTSLRSGNAEQKASAAAMVEQIKTVSPRALADIDDKTLSQANMLGAYIDGGASAAKAVQMTEEAMRTAKGNEAALKAEYGVLTKAEPTSDWLAAAHDESWWGSPSVPLTVATEFGALAQNEFIRNGGNLEAARRTALDLSKKRYGATRVNGEAVVVRNPIEQHYGVSWLSPEENAKAIKAEAVAEMNTGWTDGKLSADRVRIQPYPAKGVVAADGRPAYAIEVQDSSGQWTVQMDLDQKSSTFGLPKPWIPSLAEARGARDVEVRGAVAEAKGEVPPGAIVEGTQVYEQPKGKPKRLIGTTAGGSFRRLAPGYDKP